MTNAEIALLKVMKSDRVQKSGDRVQKSGVWPAEKSPANKSKKKIVFSKHTRAKARSGHRKMMLRQKIALKRLKRIIVFQQCLLTHHGA